MKPLNGFGEGDRQQSMPAYLGSFATGEIYEMQSCSCLIYRHRKAVHGR